MIKKSKDKFFVVIGMLITFGLFVLYQNCGGGGGGGSGGVSNEAPINSEFGGTFGGLQGVPNSSGQPQEEINKTIVFETGQQPYLVLGQASINDNLLINETTASTLQSPKGIAVTEEGRLFIADEYSQRILVWNSMPTVNNQEGNYLLGPENDLTKNFKADPASNSTFSSSLAGISIGEDNSLYVTDTSYVRIMAWNEMPLERTPASFVIGEQSFDTVSHGCSMAELRFSTQAFSVDGKLLVADTSNNRVLIWNKIPKDFIEASKPDHVLGQLNFNNCDSNNDTVESNGMTNNFGLSEPTDVWSDGTKIYVLDSGNNRILVWDSFPASGEVSGGPADRVIGQENFTNYDPVVFNNPTSFVIKNDMLFVSDTYNNRVLVWNDINKAEFLNPFDVVLGQKNSTNINPEELSIGLNLPHYIAIKDKTLIVGDTGNHRVLFFQGK